MPFTFAHPAIILPLTYLPKRWFSLTGLIIGSMTPDFEYFLRMKVQSFYSHTLNGLFWFDLPLGIALAFVFHLLVRNSLYNNLPFFAKSRLSIYTTFNWKAYFQRNWIAVILSIIIGAASHLLWDSFTHRHGYFVEQIPQLDTTIVLFEKTINNFKILQHMSTLLGSILLLYAFLKLPKDENISEEIHMKYWVIVVFLALTIILIRIVTGLDYRQYGHLIVTGISGMLLALVLTPILLKNTK